MADTLDQFIEGVESGRIFSPKAIDLAAADMAEESVRIERAADMIAIRKNVILDPDYRIPGELTRVQYLEFLDAEIADYVNYMGERLFGYLER